MSATPTERYFETLFAARPAGSLIAISHKSRGWAADFYKDPQSAAAACAGAVDVFARVTPLRELPPIENGKRGRGGAELSAALVAVWVELDVVGTPDNTGGVKVDGFDSVEHAIEVGSRVIPPSMIVGSGGGVHLYVVLVEPFVIASEADLRQATETVQGYQHAIRQAAGGVKIDSTHDPARVLRPPGTFNGKGAEPRPVAAAMNGTVERIEFAALKRDLPSLRTTTVRSGNSRPHRQVTVDQDAVSRVLAEHPGLETLSARTGGDPSANDHALVCAAARDGLEPEVIEQLLTHRLRRHGDPKGKATRRDYVPRTVESGIAAVKREQRDKELGDPLAEMSKLIGMEEIPIVAAEERHSGRVVLTRQDGRVLKATSLEALARYERLSGALAAGFGHEFQAEKGKRAATAIGFVAALRRHFGPGKIRALEDVIESWMIDLVRSAGQITFDDAASKLAAWKQLQETDPSDGGPSAIGFAKKVKLAHDTTTGDRYLVASWPHEYLRRCGWRVGPAEVVDMLVAIGLVQPNADGRVRARSRATDELKAMRFWVIPKAIFERWSS
jgi:hypothetical protein